MTSEEREKLLNDGSEAAMQRAGEQARKLAKFHNHPLVVWQDGKLCYLDPDTMKPKHNYNSPAV